MVWVSRTCDFPATAFNLHRLFGPFFLHKCISFLSGWLNHQLIGTVLPQGHDWVSFAIWNVLAKYHPERRAKKPTLVRHQQMGLKFLWQSEGLQKMRCLDVTFFSLLTSKDSFISSVFHHKNLNSDYSSSHGSVYGEFSLDKWPCSPCFPPE